MDMSKATMISIGLSFTFGQPQFCSSNPPLQSFLPSHTFCDLRQEPSPQVNRPLRPQSVTSAATEATIFGLVETVVVVVVVVVVDVAVVVDVVVEVEVVVGISSIKSAKAFLVVVVVVDVVVVVVVVLVVVVVVVDVPKSHSSMDISSKSSISESFNVAIENSNCSVDIVGKSVVGSIVVDGGTVVVMIGGLPVLHNGPVMSARFLPRTDSFDSSSIITELM